MRRNLWFGLGLVLLVLGTAAPAAHAKGSVRITFTTQPPGGGTYAPNNVVAAWIQNGAGTHQRTLGIWSAVRTIYLRSYVAAVTTIENNLPADAVSGASRLDHSGSLTVLWNLKDKAGNTVPDGTYTIRLELADRNSTAANQNNQGTFTFVKGPTSQVQNGLTNGGFSNVTINYDPNRVECGDGIIDAPETCDWTVAGSCVVNQTGCATADRCMPSMFTGDPMMCTADCVPAAPITACKSGDGCCAAGCTGENDTDCRPGGGSGSGSGENPDDNLNGGCSSGAGGGLLVFALFALTLTKRRKK
jgi:hypothetical protein